MQKGGFQDGNKLARQRSVREQATKLLQRAVDEGIASGEPQPFDFDEFISRMHKKYPESSLLNSPGDD